MSASAWAESAPQVHYKITFLLYKKENIKSFAVILDFKIFSFPEENSFILHLDKFSNIVAMS